MTDYDFSTLNYADFEKLVCDLLNCQYGDKKNVAHFRSFKVGKDKGIDLLHSTKSRGYDSVVQVKHYIKSPISNLLHDIENKEKTKVDELKPNKYIFVTSLPLNPNEKQKIKKIFDPHIKELGDILGRDDLNDILRLNPSVEQIHYKLWFSSTTVLTKILNYKYEGRRNEFTEDILKKKLRLFVVTKDYFLAKDTLEKNKYLIISGNPGVGKTTLSDILIYDYIKDDYELNIIYDSINEIEETLKNDDSKQVFYFDDFLGHTQAEINKAKSTDSILIRLLSRIQKHSNKYIILNTRKFILSPYLEESERLRNFNPLKAETQIELHSYTYGIKRRILDNHILESDLREELKQELVRLAPFICQHINFTPRIIEFFTGSKVEKFSPADFEKFILSNLKNPKEIWNHAYTKQISDFDRFLLNTLYSLNDWVSCKELELAYHGRLNYEVATNNYTKPLESFFTSLRNLNKGFLNIDSNADKNISLINPSLRDFLDYYFMENELEKERVLKSALYIEQWYFFYKPFKDLKNKIPEYLKQCFRQNIDNLCSLKIDNKVCSTEKVLGEKIFSKLIFNYYFINDIEVNKTVALLKEINDWSFLEKNIFNIYLMQKLMTVASNNEKINSLLNSLDYNFFMILLNNQNSISELIDTYNLIFKHYGFNFLETFQKIGLDWDKKEEYKAFKKRVASIFSEEIDSTYNHLKKHNTERDSHIEYIQNLEISKNFIAKHLFPDLELNFNVLSGVDWNDCADKNSMELNVNDIKSDFEDDMDEYIEQQYERYYDEDEYYEDYMHELQIGPNDNVTDDYIIEDGDELPF